MERILNIIGVVSVVASLLFVGLQMQQSQIIALGAQAQARTDGLAALYLTSLEGNEKVIELSDPSYLRSGVPDSDLLVFNQINRIRALTLQNAYQQNELGLLPEDMWRLAELRISQTIKGCQARYMLISQATPRFRGYLESASEVECPLDDTFGLR
jgi:hypothetical protein|tara:strand:- start:984 stop:1451 length:468 start_codon:yes stop_codon:yes gene_type:complete